MLTTEEYKPRLAEMSKIKIELDSDPVINGLIGITDKIAQIQNTKTKLVKLLVESVNNKSEAEMLYKDATFQYDRKLDNLLATDKNVQGQKTAEMRKATANNQLTKELLSQHHSHMDYIQADSYYKSVRHVHDLMDSAKDNISRQISVIQLGVNIDEIDREDLGTFFPGKGKTLTVGKGE